MQYSLSSHLWQWANAVLGNVIFFDIIPATPNISSTNLFPVIKVKKLGKGEEEQHLTHLPPFQVQDTASRCTQESCPLNIAPQTSSYHVRHVGLGHLTQSSPFLSANWQDQEWQLWLAIIMQSFWLDVDVLRESKRKTKTKDLNKCSKSKDWLTMLTQETCEYQMQKRFSHGNHTIAN